MKIKNAVVGGLAALLLSSCGATIPKTSEEKSPFSKEEVDKMQKEAVDQYGWAINTLFPIDGNMIRLINSPRIKIITKEYDTLRDFAYQLYRNPEAWFYLPIENKELRGYAPDEPLPAGLEIPIYMLDWQLELYQKTFPDRKVIIEEVGKSTKNSNTDKLKGLI